MELVYLIVGLLIGALAAYLATRSRGAAANALLHAERRAREEEREQNAQHLASLKQELSQRHQQELALMREQVTTATERLLKERSRELQQTNTQQMDELFRPIKDNIQRMEQSMTANREAALARQTQFEAAFRQMVESTHKVADEANRLSTALQRQNKTSGNWGELILTELLESQGLQPGTHYDVQQAMRDAAGHTLCNEDTRSRMIPDVVLHLGDQRDVVIDSKMSLTAFVDYQNATDEATRQAALARHVESVRTHIRELSAKDYSSYISKPRRSIDFVIMFVPIEGALQLALTAQPTLWREAFDKNVFVASSHTLIAALHIIRLTWITVQQERNTQRIMDEARKLIDRTSMFYKEFQVIGQKLTEASKAYAAVEKRVDEGPQSILSTGHRLEDLGARGKRSLPRVMDEGQTVS